MGTQSGWSDKTTGVQQKPEIRRVNPAQSFETDEPNDTPNDTSDAYNRYILQLPKYETPIIPNTDQVLPTEQQASLKRNFKIEGQVVFNVAVPEAEAVPVPDAFQQAFQGIDLDPTHELKVNSTTSVPQVFQQAFTEGQLDPTKKATLATEGLNETSVVKIGAELGGEVIEKSARFSIKGLARITRGLFPAITELLTSPPKKTRVSEQAMDEAKQAEAIHKRRAYADQEEAKVSAEQTTQATIQKVMIQELGQTQMTAEDASALGSPSLNRRWLETPANVAILRMQKIADNNAAKVAKISQTLQTNHGPKTGVPHRNLANEQGPSSPYNAVG